MLKPSNWQTLKSTGKHTWSRSSCTKTANVTTLPSKVQQVLWCPYTTYQINYEAQCSRLVYSSYPAGHVYIHSLLHSYTNSGLNIPLAQQLYAQLYMVSVVLTCAIYQQCRAGSEAQARSMPNWVLLLLPLSKRLHSIYVLRLFNDCWVAVAAQAGVLALASGWYNIGCILFR